MNNPYQLNNGQGLSLDAPYGQMSPQQVTAFANPYLREATDSQARALGQLGSDFIRLSDYRVASEAEKQTNEVQQRSEQRLREGLDAAPGTAKSFFFADGTINNDKVSAFRSDTLQQYAAIQPQFLNAETGLRWREEQEKTLQNAELRMEGQVGAHAIRAIRQAFDERHDLYVKQGNMGAAAKNLREAHAAGIITETKMNEKLLDLAKVALRSAAVEHRPVMIGGNEYHGVSAMLAAQGAKSGEGREAKPISAPAEAPASPPESTVVNAAPIPSGESLTLPNATASNAADDYDKFMQTGDYGSVLTHIPTADVDAFSEQLSYSTLLVGSEPKEDGGVSFYAPSGAPEAVERMAAHAEARGRIDPVDVRSTVANIALAMSVENPNAKESTILDVFDDSGYYEILGDGDASRGEAVAESIVREANERAKNGTDKLSTEAISRSVDARISRLPIPSDEEYELLNPRVAKDAKYDKPDDEAGRKRWFALYDKYKELRTQYRTERGLDIPDEWDKDEFEPIARDFFAWYTDEIYEPDRKEREAMRREAVKDWYMAECIEALANNVHVSDNGAMSYGGYASDMEVVRDVLERHEPPQDLGQDALLRIRAEREQNTRRLMAAFTKGAAEDYAKLREAKATYAENSEKAKKEREKAAAKAQKEQEKAEADAKKAEILRLRNLRAKPRVNEWAWDWRDAADGEVPACTVSADEWRAIHEELGADGTQNVYLAVAGAKILVVGANDKGKILLNAPAVMKVQAKPRKGEKYRQSGNLGYSYIFSTPKN